MDAEQVATLLRRALPQAEVLVRSADGTHFEARVISAEFVGQRALKRHQRVYGALGALVGREIHALAIEALTPEEAGGASGSETNG